MSTNENGAGAGQPGPSIGESSNMGTGFGPTDTSSSTIAPPGHQQYQSQAGNINTYERPESRNGAPASSGQSFNTQDYQPFPTQQHQATQPPNRTFSTHSHVISQSPDTGRFDASMFTQTGMSPNDEPSHGTLVISASGRSKYLGPSAASEWLKDVSIRHLIPPPSGLTGLTSAARGPRGISPTFTKDSYSLRSCLAYSRRGPERFSIHIQPADAFTATPPRLLASKRGGGYPYRCLFPILWVVVRTSSPHFHFLRMSCLQDD